MRPLTEEGRKVLADMASRYGVSYGAVEHLLQAVVAGQTTQAQFNHPDIGGMGQWSQGGMTMVGDMFNNGLKARVDGLCSELAVLARGETTLAPDGEGLFQAQSQSSASSLFVPGSRSSAHWWPEELGQAGAVGTQNDLHYAFFPTTRRLAIKVGGRVTVYDTADHMIAGFSQQQSGDQSLSFTSQHGLVRVSELRIVPTARADARDPTGQSGTEAAMPMSTVGPVETFSTPAIFSVQDHKQAPQNAGPVSAEDIFAKIEKLASLHAKGILTDEEFQAKKAELLSRI